MNRSLHHHEIRKLYLRYFMDKHRHQYLPSISVIPSKSSDLQFVNSGMNQFRSIFFGDVPSNYKRVTNYQKCIRLSGKHNDFNVVGRDTYHHTFFEMLGTWSFDDYREQESIEQFWYFLLEECELDPKNLFVSYFQKENEENYKEIESHLKIREVWEKLNVHQIDGYSFDENFWEMGSHGPCGRCTELFYRFPDGTIRELLNIVFIDLIKEVDGSLRKLDKLFIDTGIGFERLVALLQNHSHDNYSSTLFQPIFSQIRNFRENNLPNYGENNELDIYYRILADHTRMATISINDGLKPSNSGRGSILRKLLNRSYKISAHQLKLPNSSLIRLISTVIDTLNDAYPELEINRCSIENVVGTQEEIYHKKVGKSKKLMKKVIFNQKSQIISGEKIFHLFNGSYGEDIPEDILYEELMKSNKDFDWKSFQSLKRKEEETSQKILKRKLLENETNLKKMKKLMELTNHLTETCDEEKYKYKIDSNGNVNISELLVKLLEIIELDGEVYLIFNKTNFYSAEGGQPSDIGELINKNQSISIDNTLRLSNKIILHKTNHSINQLSINNNYLLKVNENYRKKFSINHSATHLLQFALRQILGDDVRQIGSQIYSNYLKFHFSSLNRLKEKSMKEIENFANELINNEKLSIIIDKCKSSDLSKNNVVHLSDFNYPSNIRTVNFVDEKGNCIYSEACCGTHVGNVKELEMLKILKFSSNNSGINEISVIIGKDNYYKSSQLIDRIEEGLEELELSKLLSPFERWKKCSSISFQLKNKSITIESVIDEEKVNFNIPQLELKRLEGRLMKLQPSKHSIRKDILKIIQKIIEESKEDNLTIVFDSLPSTFDVRSLRNKLKRSFNKKSLIIFDSFNKNGIELNDDGHWNEFVERKKKLDGRMINL
ncbi:hypothetical protein SNEBB_001000 [Seison nebaliae]|nr:hypothetical protein SNEBB_001000 [Seison nebaliae]